jgi:hypothetical protein
MRTTGYLRIRATMSTGAASTSSQTIDMRIATR